MILNLVPITNKSHEKLYRDIRIYGIYRFWIGTIKQSICIWNYIRGEKYSQAGKKDVKYCNFRSKD